MNTQLNDKKNAKITSYKFKSFNKVIKENVEDANEVKKYEFSSLENVKQIIKEKEKNLVDFISKNSQAKGFNISPIVREHKGFKDRDLQEREARIAEEIEKRFNRIKQQGFEQGYNEGFEEGKVEVYNQTKVATEEKLDALTSMISETLKTQEELLVNQKKQIYYMIRNLTKWIILKELKDDGAYIERLLERLLIEMNAKKDMTKPLGKEIDNYKFKNLKSGTNLLHLNITELQPGIYIGKLFSSTGQSLTFKLMWSK